MHNRKNFLAAVIGAFAGLLGGGYGPLAHTLVAPPSLLDQIPMPGPRRRGGKGHGWSRPSQVAKVRRAAKRRRIAARANPRGVR